MAFCNSIAQIGDKLIVGQVDTSFLTAGSRLFPGTAVLNGPVFIGANPQAGVARASCMIGPPLGISAPASLEVTGVTNIIGNLNVPAVSNFTGIADFKGAVTMTSLELKNGVDLKNGTDIGNSTEIKNSNSVVNGSLVVAGAITSPTIVELRSGIAQAMTSPPKGFDMRHPTKPGWRLTHICLEGPEAAVYYRGVLKDSNIINLPEYWKGLVDNETITVHLTSIGTYQELSYELYDWGTKIKVLNNAGSSINCSYIVYGERKDVDKIVVEYEGKIEDYPGKDQRSIVGYHYDYRPEVNL